MTRQTCGRLHYFKKCIPDEENATGTLEGRSYRTKASWTKANRRKHKNFKELIMAFEMDPNAVGIVAVAIPVIGSIALFSFLSVAVWADARRKEREAYYESETLKKIAESSGEGAKSAIELLREQHKSVTKRRLEGMKLGGLITAVVGIGVMALLHGLVHEEPVYLAGLIPLLTGLALLVYAFVLAPKEYAN
jgi:hypothetical protein